MRKPWAVLVVTLGLNLGLLTGGCSGDDAPVAAPSAQPTSLAQLRSAEMRVVRVAFCDLVPKASVHAALVAAPVRARSWRSGDRLRDAGGEIGHEFGCAWYGPHGRVARAWVFARPVTRAFATTLVRRADEDPGCRAALGRGFGNPALVQTCTRAGSPLRIRRAGLFGESWLSCELSGHGKQAALRARADTWCVSIANALNAGPGGS
jgi:hypothetical protein